MTDKEDLKLSQIDHDIIVPYFIEEDFEYFDHLVIHVSWKRVIDISDDPCLLESHDTYIDGYIICGSYTVNWFPVLFTMLRCNSFISQVLGDLRMKDNYNRIAYDGSFIFSFFSGNEWVDIKIDDRLPFMSENQKMFAISSNKEEYLPSLLEKAYAKFLGGYEKFQSINFIEAVIHFTGGVVEEVPLRRGLDPMTIQEQKSFFQTIRALPADVIGLCHTSQKSCTTREDAPQQGSSLPDEHYYIVKGWSCVPVKSRSNVVLSVLSSITDFNNTLDTADLIRLHNPVIKGDWGGSYNLGSQEWESMSEHVRRHYNLTFEHEYEFWMATNDLCRNMSAAIFCHIPNERRMDSLLKFKDFWYSFHEQGNYGGNIPGGSPDDIENKVLENDQYLVDVGSYKEVSMKAVLQVESMDKFTLFKDGCGILILKVENNRCYRLHDIKITKSVSFKILSSTARTMSISMVLLYGRYVIIPWRKGETDVAYNIRVYSSEKGVRISALMEDQPPFEDCFKCSLVKTFSRCKDSIMTTISKETRISDRAEHDRNCSSCISVNPVDAIRLTIIGAQNLETKYKQTRNNSYFILKWSNYSYKSTIKSLTNCPIWNEDFVFYRVDPAKEIISIELFYEERFGFDKSLGSHIFSEYEFSRAQDEEIVVALCIMNDKEMVPTTSKIRVKLRSYRPAEFNYI